MLSIKVAFGVIAVGIALGVRVSFSTRRRGLPSIARNIFVRITGLGDGVSDARRRVPRGDLYPAGMEPEQVDRVIGKLSGKDARLIVAGDEGVEVIHESLLQEWDTLRGWLERNRDAQRLRQQITEAAQLRQQDGRSDDDLYKGARLELAEQWEQAYPRTLIELEQAFLKEKRMLPFSLFSLEGHARPRGGGVVENTHGFAVSIAAIKP